MRTQKHDLKSKIKKLEIDLYNSILKEDATEQIRIKENLVNINKYTIMATNYSQETAQSIIEQYKFRVEALSNKIEELKAQIEVSQINKQNG